MFIDTVIVIAATQGAGLAHRLVGSVPGVFVWPWLAVPISAARHRLSPRAGRPGERGRAVRRATARQSIVAEASAGRDSPCTCWAPVIAAGVVEVIDRRMWNIAPVIAILAVLRLSHLCRLRAPARRSPSASRGDRPSGTGHGGARLPTGGSRCGTTRSSACCTVPATGRWASSSPTPCRPWPAPSCREPSRRPSRIGKVRILNRAQPAGGHGCAHRGGEGPAGCGRCGAPLARRHRAHASGARAQPKRRAAGPRGGRRQRRPVAVEPADPGVLRVRTLARR